LPHVQSIEAILPALGVGESRQLRKSTVLETDLEQMAQAVRQQTTLNSTEHTMSLNNARILIRTYGTKVVNAALNKLRWLQKEGEISNPAGFMVTAARICWRKQNGATQLGSPAPRFRGEPCRKRCKVNEFK
jgi:hypothetical protein